MPERTEGRHRFRNLRRCDHSTLRVSRVRVALVEIDTCFPERSGHEIHRWNVGPGEHFSIGRDLWVAYRRIDIKCEHLDHATTPG